MTHGLKLILALAASLMISSAASAAPAERQNAASASVVTSTKLAAPANFALQRELIGTPRAEDRIVVAQRGRRNRRRGRAAGVAAGVALGILGAAALANGARAAPPPPYYGPGPGRCARWDRLCYRGEGWACRRLRRECY
jgi:hypothetical protein